MADEVTDVYIATEAGDAGWQSLSALAAEQVDAKLPIESDDGTVTLDSPSANTFTVSTGGSERFAVASGGQVLVGETTLENANFNVHVRGEDNVQICIDSTDEDAGTGSVLKLRTGDKKYWNFQHAKTVDGSPENNQLIISNGSGTFMRGYQDNTAVFGGQVKTPSVSGLADNDASIALGTDCQILVGATQSYGLRVRPDGNVAVGGAGGGTSRFAVQGEVDGVTAFGINNIPAFGAGVTESASCYSANPSYAADSVDSAFLFSNAKLGPTHSKVKRLTGFQLDATDGVLATEENRAFFTNIPAGVGDQTNYAFFASGTAISRFAGGVNTPSVSGVVATDASIEFGAELLTTNHTPTQPNSIATKQTVDDKIWVGTTAEYNALATKNAKTLYCLTD